MIAVERKEAELGISTEVLPTFLYVLKKGAQALSEEEQKQLRLLHPNNCAIMNILNRNHQHGTPEDNLKTDTSPAGMLRRLQQLRESPHELLCVLNQLAEQISTNKQLEEEFASLLRKTMAQDSDIQMLVWLCRGIPVLIESAAKWEQLEHLVSKQMLDNNQDAYELLDMVVAWRKKASPPKKIGKKDTKKHEKVKANSFISFTQIVRLVKSNKSHRLSELLPKDVMESIKEVHIDPVIAFKCLVSAYQMSCWTPDEKRESLKWLVSVSEHLQKPDLKQLEPKIKELVLASRTPIVVKRLQTGVKVETEQPNTRLSITFPPAESDSPKVTVESPPDMELTAPSAASTLSYYQLVLATASEKRAVIQEWSRVVNSLLEEAYSRPYGSTQSLEAALQHLCNYLKVGLQHFPRTDIKIDRLVLRVIDQLTAKEEFSAKRWEDSLTSIYRHLSDVEQQAYLTEHAHTLIEGLRNGPLTNALVVLRALYLSANSAAIECAKHLQGELEMLPTEAINSSGCWPDLFELMLIAETPSNSRLVQQFCTSPQAYHEKVGTKLLLRMCKTHKASLQKQTLLKEMQKPTTQLVDYLKESAEGRQLLEAYRTRNWRLYKVELFNDFKKAAENEAPIDVRRFYFRGDLINDKPFVVESVKLDDSSNCTQWYFMNLSGFISILYASLKVDTLQGDQICQCLSQILANIKGLAKEGSRQEIDQLYLQRLCWWRILTIVVAKAIQHSDLNQQLFAELADLALTCLARSVSPCIRQYYELVLVSLLKIDRHGRLQAELLKLLEKESRVGTMGPLVLILGYRMTKTNSVELFRRLAIYIASHIAYVRGLSQYYCFQFYQTNKDSIEASERPFFEELSSYSVGNKDSRKLMKNIGKGVESFKQAANNLTDLRVVMTVDYEKVEEDAITYQTYMLLEQDGRDFLANISLSKLSQRMEKVVSKAAATFDTRDLAYPSFDTYVLNIEIQLSTHNREQEIIVVASLLEKPPNFGHLMRTLSNYPFTTLVVPSAAMLHEPECLEVYSEHPSATIIEVKEKDMLSYLSVQKQRGFSVVALEQATRSIPLEKFEFPRRCVLVLGNERLGMSSEVIEMADYLVEIQQFGKVRSLNVHVSSVLFLWAYQTSLE